MSQLERSTQQRPKLQTGWMIFQAAVAAGIADPAGIDQFALRMQELHEDRLISYRARSAGTIDRPVWDAQAIQERHDWRVTADGRRDALVYLQQRTLDDQPRSSAPAPTPDKAASTHDVFISHASEDKDSIARPLAHRLREHGWRVWFDEFELRPGDSLRRSIDRGLAGSRFGVVVLSPAFFAKEWPQRELDGLTARETANEELRVVPIWHGLEQADVARHSPTLADRVAIRDTGSLDRLVADLRRTIGDPPAPATQEPEHAARPDVRLSPVPRTVKQSPIVLGRDLTRLIDGSFEGIFDLDNVTHPDNRRIVAELFDEVRDLLDVLDEHTLVQREELETQLTLSLVDLINAGIMVLGGNYRRTLTGPTGAESWPGAVLRAIEMDDEMRATIASIVQDAKSAEPPEKPSWS